MFSATYYQSVVITECLFFIYYQTRVFVIIQIRCYHFSNIFPKETNLTGQWEVDLTEVYYPITFEKVFKVSKDCNRITRMFQHKNRINEGI